MNDEDDVVRDAFRTLKENDRVPSFARVHARAEGAIRARSSRRTIGVALAVTAVLVLVVLVTRPTDHEPWPIVPQAIEPLAFLMRPPSASVGTRDGIHAIERSW